MDHFITTGHQFSRHHTFSEEQVKAFALAAGDENPVHHDAAYASGTRLGRPIASATQTTALLMGLAATHFSRQTTALGLHFSVELLRPVFADETVLLAWTVSACSAHHKGGHIVELHGSMTGADGRVRICATGSILVGSAP